MLEDITIAMRKLRRGLDDYWMGSIVGVIAGLDLIILTYIVMSK